MKKLIAGNWKMNGLGKDAQYLAESIAARSVDMPGIEWLVCPPFVHLVQVGAVLDDSLAGLGAQDCSPEDQGARTGDISADMLADIGCSYCIAGHSERRAGHGEGSEAVRAKAGKILENNMKAIICVGETLEEREGGNAFAVVESQIRQSLPENATADNCVIAYEPVWAIGTGRAASAGDVVDMHENIRKLIESLLATGDRMRIIYGGSVKPGNAEELLNLPHVNGALIGGASLKADDFIAIGRAAKP